MTVIHASAISFKKQCGVNSRMGGVGPKSFSNLGIDPRIAHLRGPLRTDSLMMVSL